MTARIISGWRWSMRSALTSSRSKHTINTLPNIEFIMIIDSHDDIAKNQKSGFIRYGTNGPELFGRSIWIADREKADRPFSGLLRIF